MNKKTIPVMITPDEALKISANITSTLLEYVKKLYDTYQATNYSKILSLLNNVALWDIMRLMAFAYNTGRIQGVREERQKQRKRTEAL